MLLVSDVHGAFESLRRVASLGEPLVIIGDLLNFIDYRTMDGLFTDVVGRDRAIGITALRARGDHEGARTVWHEFAEGRQDEVRQRFEDLTLESYAAMAEALGDAEAYVTFGNVDRPDLLAAALPESARFIVSGAIEIEGLAIGIVGGGVPKLGVPGEVDHQTMASRLAALPDVDVLCTHVAPAVRQLSGDVVGGSLKESPAVLDHLLARQPSFHYFGDIHQPQATEWRVGATRCRNVGYFRATGRAVRHG